MSLVKCPECRRNVSDKAYICIYCGYSLRKDDSDEVYTKNDLGIIEKSINEIADIFKSFLENPDVYGCSMENMYNLVKPKVNIIYDAADSLDENEKLYTNDAVAKVIMNGLVNCSDYCSWPVCVDFSKLIKFPSLSESILEYIGNILCEKVLEMEYYSDGSYGYNKVIIFHYPIYQLTKCGSTKIQEKLKINLNKPMNSFSTKSIYDEIISCAHTFDRDNFVGIKVNKKETEDTKGIILGKTISTDIVKCPRCQSTQITTGSRGFSLLTGFVGASKTINRCARCGYTWKPRSK